MRWPRASRGWSARTGSETEPLRSALPKYRVKMRAAWSLAGSTITLLCTTRRIGSSLSTGASPEREESKTSPGAWLSSGVGRSVVSVPCVVRGAVGSSHTATRATWPRQHAQGYGVSGAAAGRGLDGELHLSELEERRPGVGEIQDFSALPVAASCSGKVIRRAQSAIADRSAGPAAPSRFGSVLQQADRRRTRLPSPPEPTEDEVRTRLRPR